MDADHFDALARSLSTAASSRRQLLTGVASSALGALAVTLGFAEAEATHVTCLHVGQRCTDSSECCSSRCKRKRGTSKRFCRAHDVRRCTAAKDSCLTGTPSCGGGNCYCYPTTGGANFCAAAGGVCMACTTDAECAVALGSPGAACIANNANCLDCSNASPTVCLFPCTK